MKEKTILPPLARRLAYLMLRLSNRQSFPLQPRFDAVVAKSERVLCASRDSISLKNFPTVTIWLNLKSFSFNASGALFFFLLRGCFLVPAEASSLVSSC